MTPAGFLFDRNFSRPIARMIGHYEPVYPARHQDDDARFVHRMPDVELIRTLAADPDRRWTLISQDRRITTHPEERAALDASGLKFFYFGRAWFRMSPHEQAWRFVRAWPDLVQVALHHKRRLFEIEGVNLKITPVP